MGERKTKAIQTDLGTFRNNQAYPAVVAVNFKRQTGIKLKLWGINLTWLLE